MREWRNYLVNLFAYSFLRKDKIPLTYCRRSNYDAGQEILIGAPESSDVSEVKVPKLSAGKRVTNLGHDGRGGILQLRPPYGSHRRKA